jgi:hypothetical protein
MSTGGAPDDAGGSPFSPEPRQAARRLAEDIAAFDANGGALGGDEALAGQDLQEGALARCGEVSGADTARKALARRRPTSVRAYKDCSASPRQVK